MSPADFIKGDNEGNSSEGSLQPDSIIEILAGFERGLAGKMQYFYKGDI